MACLPGDPLRGPACSRPMTDTPRADQSLMKAFFRHQWPVVIAVAAYWLAAGALALVSLHLNQGNLVYALDDAYIHMALAKNFATHGVWGITPFGFTSSVSSLLWPLLVTFSYWLFGVNQASPLILNLLSGALTLVVADHILRRYKASCPYRAVALLVITFLSIIVPLTLQGMEHLLQMAVTLLATFLAARYLSDDEEVHTPREFLFLLLAAPLVTAARFEGMFLIAVIGALMLLRKRWLHAVTFGAAGLLPVAIDGVISMLKGWYGLPNSVLLKGSTPPLGSLWKAISYSINTALFNLGMAPHIAAIGLAVLFLSVYAYRARVGPATAWESRQVMTLIFIGLTWLHLEFAIVCEFCRYDAYLILLGLVIVAVQLVDLLPQENVVQSLRWNELPRYLVIAALAGMLILPLGSRGLLTPSIWLTGTSNIFEQQYQMGLFMKTYYQGSAVALNDIGAVDYLADVRCVDLVGLANLEVARKKLRKNYHTADILAVTRESGVRVAVVYDSWFGGEIGGLPEEWTKVGEWTIPHNIVAADKTVSFYAVNPSEVAPLTQHLRDFSPRLPASVMQSGKYTEWASAP